MIDISVAYNRYNFLGSEFLVWLWKKVDEEQETLNEILNIQAEYSIGSGIVIENKGNNTKPKSRISIKGAEAGTKEAMIAILDGGMIKELSLIIKTDSLDFQMSIKDDLSIKSLKIHGAPTDVRDPEDIEGIILERVYLDFQVFSILDKLYASFIKNRIDDEWDIDKQNFVAWMEKIKG